MSNANITHEIISINPDVDVHLRMSIDQGSYTSPHWHNSIELVYMIEESMDVYFENEKVHLASWRIYSCKFPCDPFCLKPEKSCPSASDSRICVKTFYP